MRGQVLRSGRPLPFLDTFPQAKVTGLDILDHRVEFLEDIRRRGISNLLPNREKLLQLLGWFHYIGDSHTDHLREASRRLHRDEERQCRETDPLPTMEGPDIKAEEDGR